MAVEKKQTVTKWMLSNLKDHPAQATMFGDVDEAELAALAENMREHGLRQPVEITPDGIVIAGHQRVRAARRLGWKEIDVIVRHDLAAMGAAAIERHFVEDNFVRRQLSPLARARCIRRLMELEECGSARRFASLKKEELKTRIATRMALSVRSINRYLLLLDTPAAIQAAFDRSALSLVVAGRVALLRQAQQMEIASRIEGGEEPVTVVREFTAGGPSAPSDDAGRAFVRLMGALKRELPKIAGHVDRIPPGRIRHSAPVLREAVALLGSITTSEG